MLCCFLSVIMFGTGIPVNSLFAEAYLSENSESPQNRRHLNHFANTFLLFFNKDFYEHIVRGFKGKYLLARSAQNHNNYNNITQNALNSSETWKKSSVHRNKS